MLKRVAAGLVVLALGAAPAAAANITGWYAGIYAGGSSANDIDFSFDEYYGVLVGPGTIETPSSYVNDGGLDPDFFDFLNEGPAEYPFADLGIGAALLVNGTLDLLNSPTMGAVVGYGFGNGLRVEGDVSAASFGAGIFTSRSELIQNANGDIDGSGVWTWTSMGDFTLPLTPPAPLEDAGFIYSSDVQFLLLSAFYDIDTGTAVTPYLGGGLGLARITNTLEDTCFCSFATQTRLAPAAQLGGGVRVALSNPVSLDLGYRYKLTDGGDLSSADIFFDGFGGYAGFATSASGIIGVHTLQAGLTFALQ